MEGTRGLIHRGERAQQKGWSLEGGGGWRKALNQKWQGKQREAFPWALHWKHRGAGNTQDAALLCVWILGCC